MNPEDTIYLYSVYPKKVIKGLPCNAIRTPKSLYLTKEQVLICLKSGSVYRRFANQGINEKVNINNIDRLHNETYMDEKEYKEYLESLEGKERGEAVVNETPETSVIEEQPAEQSIVNDNAEATIIEEQPAEQKSITEEPIANETSVVEEAEQSIVNDNAEVEDNIAVEKEEKTAEEPEKNTEDKNQNKNNYNGKNKHRR